MTLKLTLFGSTHKGADDIAHRLPQPDDTVTASLAFGGVEDLATEIESSRPDLLVVELPALGVDELARVESALARSPATAMVLMTGDRSPEYLLRAMRAGVREIVPVPVAGDELKAAYGRQLERAMAARGIERKARVLAFLPAKGGSGSTFVATNLAYALAMRGKRVALIDMNLHSGDAVLFLTEGKPTRTIADLARESARFDATFVESAMMQVGENLWVLPAPDTPEGPMDVTPDAVGSIVSFARTRFDFVLLDMGRILDAPSVRALDQAEALYVTLQLTLPFLHDAKRLLALLATLGYERDKLHMIVNRWEKGGEITSGDVQKSLGVPVDLEVPNSFAAVAHSINHGIPILNSAPRDPVSKALLVLADRLAPQTAERKRGWFGR